MLFRGVKEAGTGRLRLLGGARISRKRVRAGISLAFVGGMLLVVLEPILLIHERPI